MQKPVSLKSRNAKALWHGRNPQGSDPSANLFKTRRRSKQENISDKGKGH